MADTASDADKIRMKRLAKLQNQAPARPTEDGNQTRGEASASQSGRTPSAGQADPSDRSEQPDQQPSSSRSETATATGSTSSNPFAQLEMKPLEGESKIRIRPATSATTTTSKQESAGEGQRTSSPGGRSLSTKTGPGESFEQWEGRVLSNMFRITLQWERQQDAHGHQLRYLSGVTAELEEQGEDKRLSLPTLEQAILEVASNIRGVAPLDYLLACWKRITRQLRGMRSDDRDNRKLNVIKEARRLCMSYCIFAITMPEMFGVDPPTSNALAQHLLVDPEDDRGLCHDFLTEAVRRFGEDDSMKEALVGAVEELSRQLAGMTMNDNYKPYILALRNLVRYPPLVDAITDLPGFLPPKTPAQDIERKTFLGPFFQISPLQGEVTVNYFSSPKGRDKGYIISSQKALRMTLQNHQTELLDIVNQIIRSSKKSRDRMLDWFALTVNANHKRRALQVDNDLVSSDGFMVNVTVCLDQLCEPFMDSTFSKIDRIEVDYLRRNPRVDIKQETKLNADQHASDRFYSNVVPGSSNFISEVFFLTLAAHHYGTEATITKLDQLEKDLKHMEKELVRFEEERSKWINTPQLVMFENTLRKFQEAINKGLSYKYAVQGVLYDDLSQARSMQFMRYVIVWMLRLAAPPHDYPQQQPQRLPLPKEEPEAFTCLPEYFLDNIISNFRFILRTLPHVLTSTQSDELITLCITFLRSSEYIKNPYLKSGLVSLLFNGIWPTYGRAKGVLGDVLVSFPFATEHLLHAVLKFYIEAETTGGHNQFFDKFNIRYEIFQIIKCIWSNPIYRERLSQEAKKNLDFFVRFVNLLLNDVTFVLDESLNAFGKIHRLQIELEDASLEQNERTEKEEQLAQSESMAKSYMQLTNETLAMLKLFTDALADSFTMPEIVQRLADMLDYNLDAMVGPKRTNLQVRQPEQYGFQPRVLLSEIVDVYLNLRDKKSFIDAVAKDGRSYKPANFEKAGEILSKWGLKSSEDLEAWTTLGERVRLAKEADDQDEEDLGEIPDEFLDPLMYTLMEDPVVLPASRISIDRATIRSHLLSDPHDPFNRVPLSIEDVRPDTELKAKIEAFKSEKRGKRLVGGGGDGDAMDTSA
ncbi:MAG: hypothetical protein M1816_007935 [Peltula sp. TS41687]|nr:MAG: hypothetical protein M1816_007935 [Peltula sp. TS41687]